MDLKDDRVFIRHTLRCDDAIRDGNIDKLETLFAERPLKDLCSRAIRHGNLPVLQWAVRNGHGAMDADLCAEAAARRQWDVVEWAIESGFPCDERACAEAAADGRHDVIERLRTRGCPWDARACKLAARARQVSTLEWLLDQGCPCDDRACVAAAKNGDVAALALARKSGCSWGKDDEICRLLGKAGDAAALEWAHENGCPCRGRCLAAARQGADHIAAVRWLMSESGPPALREDRSRVASLVAAREQSRKRLVEEEEPVIKAERKAKRMRRALAPTAAATRLAELACLMLSPLDCYDSETSFGHASALTDWFLLDGLHADVIPLFERIVAQGEDPEEVPGEVCRQVREGFASAKPAMCHIDVTHRHVRGNEYIWKVRAAKELCKTIYDSDCDAVWRIPESAKSLKRWINKDDAQGFWISNESMYADGLRLTVASPPGSADAEV